MANIFTPTNQKRLTNVCVVRMKKHGGRFEVACYPNKVAAWRSKVEKDLSEVLQTNTVFTNVAKGKLAKREELEEAFGTDDQEQITLEILANGEIQVTEKERQAQSDAQLHDVATFVAGQCVQIRPKAPPLPLSAALVEKAMRELHIALRPNRSTKQNGLEVMRKLKSSSALEMQRCQMRLQVTVTAASGGDAEEGPTAGELRKLRGRLASKFPQPAVKIESEQLEDTGLNIELLCDPGVWHELEAYLHEETRGASRTQVLAVKELPVEAATAADEEPDEEAEKSAAGGKSGAKGGAAAAATRDESSDEDEKAERSKRGRDKRGKEKARGEARDHKAAQQEAGSDEGESRQHKSTKAPHEQHPHQHGDDEEGDASGDEASSKSQQHKEQHAPQKQQQQQQQATKSKKKGKGKHKDESDEDDAPHGRQGRRRGQRGLEEEP